MSLHEPLQQIEKHLLTHQTSIESWIKDQLIRTPPPIYCSVDLRNAGFKLAPIDTNLFPAGFNNLHPDFLVSCIKSAQTTLTQGYPNVKKIILIPEDHTRNIYYYENIAIIKKIFTEAGFEVRIGSLLPTLKDAETIHLPSGGQIRLEPLIRNKKLITLHDFCPDLILLNNDLSAGVPEILQELDQLIMPPLSAGWYSRLKSNHFAHFATIAAEFGNQFGIDPWLISPLFRYCGNVNFMLKDGEQCVINHAKELLGIIEEKYRHYGISQKPFLVIKADSGTYGMAVMTIQDPGELLNLNRKERKRMTSIKGGREVHKVIIQEGIYTLETSGSVQATAEPVIYMLGQDVVGGFYRVHPDKGNTENLNAPGMYFEPIPNIQLDGPDQKMDNSNKRFYIYSIIARLALIAAARELAAKPTKQEEDNVN